MLSSHLRTRFFRNGLAYLVIERLANENNIDKSADAALRKLIYTFSEDASLRLKLMRLVLENYKRHFIEDVLPRKSTATSYNLPLVIFETEGEEEEVDGEGISEAAVGDMVGEEVLEMDEDWDISGGKVLEDTIEGNLGSPFVSTAGSSTSDGSLAQEDIYLPIHRKANKLPRTTVDTTQVVRIRTEERFRRISIALGQEKKRMDAIFENEKEKEEKRKLSILHKIGIPSAGVVPWGEVKRSNLPEPDTRQKDKQQKEKQEQTKKKKKKTNKKTKKKKKSKQPKERKEKKRRE
eukprot:TRINITY_DN8897_c3_g1_i1.p1 TRINITY_DN8897_c3_g1~~TRINITY_DN8897_c3_g1_i1.p1  ORF type:complete len:293 (+),score=88.52 TRINITY_DN8897_c3_g1_i1:402-1280(+)